MPPLSSETLWLGINPVSLILGVSEATLDLLGSQPHGSLSLNFPGLVLSSRYWTGSTSAESLDYVRKYFDFLYSLLGIYSFPLGTSPSLEKNNSEDACLTDELRRHSNQAFPFGDLGLSLTGHWVRKMSPNLKCSWYPLISAPPPLAVVLYLISSDWLVTILRQPRFQKVPLWCQPSHCWAVTWKCILRGGLSLAPTWILLQVCAVFLCGARESWLWMRALEGAQLGSESWVAVPSGSSLRIITLDYFQ